MVRIVGIVDLSVGKLRDVKKSLHNFHYGGRLGHC